MTRQQTKARLGPRKKTKQHTTTENALGSTAALKQQANNEDLVRAKRKLFLNTPLLRRVCTVLAIAVRAAVLLPDEKHQIKLTDSIVPVLKKSIEELFGVSFEGVVLDIEDAMKVVPDVFEVLVPINGDLDFVGRKNSIYLSGFNSDLIELKRLREELETWEEELEKLNMGRG